jgi:hypothetical protein
MKAENVYNDEMYLRKINLYVDTSVVGMVNAPHAPAKEAITKEFFRLMMSGEYRVIASPVLMEEIHDAPEPIRKQSLAVLRSVRAVEMPEQQEAETLARLYVERAVLGDRHINDLRHVAYAVLERCDYVVSWNMKHLVRVQTIERVNAVNFEYRYPAIQIVTPEFITGELVYA